jgi:hypothetical protein
VEGIKQLTEAGECYRATLRVCSETHHPADWADTQFGLAHLQIRLVTQNATFHPEIRLRDALAHIDNARRAYGHDTMGSRYKAATRVREEILAVLNAIPSSPS